MMRALWSALALTLALVSSGNAAEIHLAVTASMRDAVQDLVSEYEQTNRDVRFLPNFASSGALARQIVQGAPVDLFISANAAWMRYLVEENRIDRETVRPFALNALVFVGSKDLAISTLEEVTTLRRIAIGSPGSVPAGQYAEQALKSIGIFDELRGRLVMAKDVRQALIYADRGETDGAFVYRTDAALAQNAVVLLEVPPALHDPVALSMALTAEGAKKPEVKAFYAFMQSDAAAAVLRRHGFGTSPGGYGQLTMEHRSR